jgi:hypothetical protein
MSKRTEHISSDALHQAIERVLLDANKQLRARAEQLEAANASAAYLLQLALQRPYMAAYYIRQARAALAQPDGGGR